MNVIKNVHSSNLTFKQLEVNVDTVFYRFNEKEWIEDDVQLGWIYDEIWYEKDNYIEKISEQNSLLESTIVEMANSTYETQTQIEGAITELVEMMGGMM